MTIRELKELVNEIVRLDYTNVYGEDAASVTDETKIALDCTLSIAQMRRIVVAADQGVRMVDAQFGSDMKGFEEVALRDVRELFEAGFPKIEMTVEPEYEERRGAGPLDDLTMYVKGRRIAFHAYGPQLRGEKL